MRRRILRTALALCLVLAIGALTVGMLPRIRYARGMSLRNQGRWSEAVASFREAGGYADAAEQIRETEYRWAAAQVKAGDYAGAYATYAALTGYKDVNEILAGNDCFVALAAGHARKAEPYTEVGSIVTFGHYEQDGDENNGKEPIEWIVVDQKDGKAMLVSRYGLDCKAFHSRRQLVTWDKSSLRFWLNSDFAGMAFDDVEREAIARTTVDNSKAQSYAWYDTSSGSDTQDKVFLLSYQEAWKYFPTEADRETTATEYANRQGAYISTVNGNCWWWLRSTGISRTCATLVHYDGKRGDYLVNSIYAAIRPCIWLDLQSPYFSKAV